MRVLLALLMTASLLARAAPAHIEQSVPQARLAGKGDFTWFALQVYSAELWVGPGTFTPAAPFALELRYARKLAGRKIAQASAEQMEKIGAGSAVQRQAWLQQMVALFPDVAEGTRITGVHVPQQGARFYLDGVLLGSVNDPQFARAFFGIWLDPATTAPALRRALLQNAAPP